MTSRRRFLAQVSAGTSAAFTGCCLSPYLHAQNAARKRREVTVGGQRVRTVDIHAHVIIPEATAMMGVKTEPSNASVMAPARFDSMDEWGTDMQALSINANWYHVEGGVAPGMIHLN
jgi:hypothetical protein